LARGYSPWRPDAVIGTTRGGIRIPRPLKGRGEFDRTPEEALSIPPILKDQASFGFQGPVIRENPKKRGLPMKLECSLRLWTPISEGIEFQGPLWPMWIPPTERRERGKKREGNPPLSPLSLSP